MQTTMAPHVHPRGAAPEPRPGRVYAWSATVSIAACAATVVVLASYGNGAARPSTARGALPRVPTLALGFRGSPLHGPFIPRGPLASTARRATP